MQREKLSIKIDIVEIREGFKPIFTIERLGNPECTGLKTVALPISPTMAGAVYDTLEAINGMDLMNINAIVV